MSDQPIIDTAPNMPSTIGALTADTWENFQLALPQPYNNTYRVHQISNGGLSAVFQLQKVSSPLENDAAVAAKPLHNENLFFSKLSKGEEVSLDNNTPWARARRSLLSTIEWKESDAPAIGQVWLVIYAIFSIAPEQEHFRLILRGEDVEHVQHDLKSVGLAIDHPISSNEHIEASQSQKELLVLRSTFWQGAGSPFGARAVWLADPIPVLSTGQSVSEYPPMPLDYTFSTKFPAQRIYARHPIRPAKPTPGSTIYSRYIPHLKEHFSMVALDYENPEHLNLFHNWQNDPRVAQGWNETGTLDQHREYLRNLHNDKHTITILAKFEDTFFAYFEVYWAKVC
jgi:hypothetical protein